MAQRPYTIDDRIRDVTQARRTEVAGLLDWFKSSPKPAEAKPTPEPTTRTLKQDPPSKDYPSVPELETSKGFEQFYGSEHAPYFEAGKAQQRQTTPQEVAKQYNKTGNIAGMWEVSKPTNWEQSDRLHAAWLASERSAVSKLGFNPSKAVESYDPNTKLNVYGLYNRKTDKIWYDAASPDTLVHESLHRGIQQLRDQDKLPESFKDLEGKVQNWEELAVRAMMVRHFGDIEVQGDPNQGAGNLQVKEAKRLIPDAELDKLEKAAAEHVAKKRPGGPR